MQTCANANNASCCKTDVAVERNLGPFLRASCKLSRDNVISHHQHDWYATLGDGFNTTFGVQQNIMFLNRTKTMDHGKIISLFLRLPMRTGSDHEPIRLLLQHSYFGHPTLSTSFKCQLANPSFGPSQTVHPSLPRFGVISISIVRTWSRFSFHCTIRSIVVLMTTNALGDLGAQHGGKNTVRISISSALNRIAPHQAAPTANELYPQDPSDNVNDTRLTRSVKRVLLASLGFLCIEQDTIRPFNSGQPSQ